MADYILRDDAVQCAEDIADDFYGDDASSGALAVAEWLKDIPAADVRPVVHGKWEHISFMTCRCSVCKEVFHELEGDNFCPTCGAEMRAANDRPYGDEGRTGNARPYGKRG